MPRRARTGPAGAIGFLLLHGMLAHHGGGGNYDASRPLYLRGRVIQARYGYPHARLRIEVPSGLTVPSDLPGVEGLRGHDAWAGPPEPEGAGEVRELLLPPDLTGTLGGMPGRPQVGDDVAAVVYRRCEAEGDEYSGELRVQMIYAAGGAHPYRGTLTRFVDRCLRGARSRQAAPAATAPGTGAPAAGADGPPLFVLGGGAAVAAGFAAALIRLRTRRTSRER
ncbi:hypothetical protein GCM10023085_08440 [Actinomadura viridis]|uniref:Uncharacterized protein n=1 Tax=Actinomadura viridis TaxID=58110 RepID=A0A931DKU5_9ACTN|nr:hypothetical protein [Actinomadura viridis]MBG6091855.1 hypothetical protein [Actinomadura viridis]